MTPARSHLQPTRPRAARIAALAVAVAAVATACNDDGREMRAPGPDQTLSIVTTTLPPLDPPTIDTLPPGIGTEAPSEVTLDTTSVDTAPLDTDLPVVPDDDALALEGFEVTLPWPAAGEIDRRFTCDGSEVSPAIGWTGLPENTVEVAIVVIDPDAEDFVHWIVAGIDPSLGGLGEATVPGGAIQAANGAGVTGWSGPCPPDGERHTYRFEVHALSQQTEIPDGAPADEMQRAIDFATIAMAVGTGTYSR